MKFTVKDIKLTLRSDSGETFVLEESCDTRETRPPSPAADTSRKSGGTTERDTQAAKKPAAAESASAKRPRDETAEGAARKSEKKTERQESDGSTGRAATTSPRAGASSKKAGATPSKTEAAMSKEDASRKPRSLIWKPHTEFGYDGFAARDGQGIFKILKARNTQWALLYDQVGVDSVPLGCHRALEDAKKSAQEHHDKGMPDKRRLPPVCPADAPEAPPEAPAAPQTHGELTPEMRAQMLGGMKEAIRTAIESVP